MDNGQVTENPSVYCADRKISKMQTVNNSRRKSFPKSVTPRQLVMSGTTPLTGLVGVL